MKQLIILLLGIFVPMLLVAQTDSVRYTLSEDREFIKESDFTGYTFIPSEGKMSTAHYPDPIAPGVVKFSVFNSYLLVDERARYTPGGIVDPPTDDKPYRLRISRIDKIPYGYHMKLIDPENRDLQGYLKIYIDGISQVDMLKYRPSMADPEHTYIIARTSKEQLLEDGKFFTHQQDFDARTLDEFWGKVLYPFLSLENQSNLDYRKISRIYRSDDVDIRFEEETVAKGKKEKILQYIIFNQKDGTRRKLLVKKLKEIEYQNRDAKRTVLEVEVKDENTQENYFILMHRGIKSYLKAIELQDEKTRQSLLYYEMRRGKRIIE
ncbi:MULTISPECIES: hypothetical protein [unclassified Aureispira]|uniref:hypothetical protein n=1 Tax=unclassified Aureispira TaxID=2649989 RepID=UPI00069693E0|nr:MULTISPECIES: hypothetical protein [unclassified Aureispira]WMX14854.1 hypothetical protein QP953_00550 [Aureispira sp. CCB-E]